MKNVSGRWLQWKTEFSYKNDWSKIKEILISFM